jgi:predicted Ser/Thr protein kinase
VTTVPSRRPEEARVGAYRLLAPIGEGGMGVVHLAQGPDGRRVALKVLRQHIVGDSEARERLAREVSSLQRIRSPRIAEIIDSDPHGPVPFVVTRYVPGLSLYHHVAEEGPVSGADLLHFADALAEALQAVHAVGVLHRDVKPTNVLMEGRSPVLIDFGLARLAEDPRLTQTGWLLGTPGYLAPEILYGDDATVASDVHAWAATVVFAATGRPPYGKGPAIAIMDRVRRGEHDLSRVPAPLVGLLRDCLVPEPLERPSVHELRASIHGQQQRAHLARQAQAVPESESGSASATDLWTMPYRPESGAGPTDGAPATDRLPLAEQAAEEGSGRSDAGVPVHEAVPYQQPAPPAVPTTGAAPATRVVPPDESRPEQPLVPYIAPTPRESSRAQQVLQLVGLGAFTSALVGYAPYAGTALVALLVLLLRTASVTRQRHGRRRLVRGRSRWYDVPTTTLALPGYLLLAFFGALALVLVAGMAGLAMFSLGYLLGQPMATGMLLGGLGFSPALWWGPGSGRVREMTRGLVTRTARSEFGGWFVTAICLLGAAVLLGLLLSGGPTWAPALSAPWS